MGLGVRSRVLAAAGGVSTRVTDGVALTFDDGPVPGTTDRLLDLLAGLDVRATFFCVGSNADRHRTLLRRVHEAGHVIGSHSFSHSAPGVLTGRRLVQDYALGRQAVEQVLGTSVPLFRPPYGALPLTTSRFLRSCRTWTWSIDPRDWAEDVSREDVVRAAAGARSGDVVLLHDWVENASSAAAQDRTRTLDAVPDVVRRLRAAGLPLVTLPA